MNAEKLFSTKERVKIIRGVIYSEEGFGVNETASELNLSKGLVSKYFEILAREGLIKRRGNRFFVLDNSKVKAVKIMLNVLNINPEIFKKYKFVKASGLYGSCTKGTNKDTSDVDLWVKVDKVQDEELAGLILELRKKIENVKVLILDDKKLEVLRKEDPVFYHSLHFGSIILYGGEDEI
jgi:predicted nucleotidyltransferase